MSTHLEHKQLPTATAPQSLSDSLACANGTLLSGGYNLKVTLPYNSVIIPITLGVISLRPPIYIANDSPHDEATRTPKDGDFAQRWYVQAHAGALGATLSGEIWVTCWDAAGSATPTIITGQPTATIAAQPTATIAAQPTATPAPQPTDTPRPQPTPTNTPAPQCQEFMQGSASNVNVDLSDINLDGTGPATLPNASSHIRYSQLPASGSIFSPVNNAALHDVGIGADYGALDCARLRGFGYSGASTAPDTVGEVFAVKTPGGHYAKVLISAGVGGPLQVQWVTYSPS